MTAGLVLKAAHLLRANLSQRHSGDVLGSRAGSGFTEPNVFVDPSQDSHRIPLAPEGTFLMEMKTLSSRLSLPWVPWDSGQGGTFPCSLSAKLHPCGHHHGFLHPRPALTHTFLSQISYLNSRHNHAGHWVSPGVTQKDILHPSPEVSPGDGRLLPEPLRPSPDAVPGVGAARGTRILCKVTLHRIQGQMCSQVQKLSCIQYWLQKNVTSKNQNQSLGAGWL